MIGRESDSPAVRRRAHDAYYRRTKVLGWSPERAAGTPIEARGYARREGVSLDEVAAELGVSRERARQIEYEAIAKVRLALVRAWRRDGLDVRDVLHSLDARSGPPDMALPADGYVPDPRREREREAREARRVELECGAWSEDVRRAERECDEGITAITETAAAHRAIERVIDGLAIEGGAW